MVEDNPLNRDVLSKILKDVGVQVEESENGQEALEKLSQFSPDIIFTDMNMPVMDGPQLIRAIEQEYGKERFKIIAVSAAVLKHEQKKFLSCGCHGFIGKPFRFDTIFTCLEDHLNVKFEYEEVVKDTSAEKKTIDYSQVHLPADTLAQLKKAAKFGQISEMEKQDSVAPELVQHLKAFADKFQLGALQKALDQIKP
ncbi:MAG: response regulator [Nitrospinae bacterium]|nr:response regulator [Nitrospinota bacterium]